MPLVVLRGLTKRYPRRRDRPRRADARPRARDHRPRRGERGRQEHAPQDPARAARADLGDGRGHGHATCATRAPTSASTSATCPSPTACRRSHRRPTSSATWPRCRACRRSAARERTAEVLRHVGLYEERYRPIGGYSTGMKQRVKLAQALVHDPRLLLLDEPTNGLDPAGRDEMLALVRRTGHRVRHRRHRREPPAG